MSKQLNENIKQRTIIFRADGGSSIGMGHFIRTFALAEMLKDDFNCVYATQSPSDYQIYEISSVCHERIDLPADETHFEVFVDQLQGDEIVVLDNYYFSTDYQYKIKKKGCSLVCIDDMHNQHFVADIVINQSPGARGKNYSIEKYTKLLLGFDYALLRSAFTNNSISETKKRYSLLVIMGGADPLRLTPPIIKKLCLMKWDLPIAVVYSGDEIDNVDNIIKFKDLSAEEIAGLMCQSQIGLFPASTVSIEACACRLPFVTGYFIENQELFYSSLINNNLAIGVNRFDTNLQALPRVVTNLYNNKALQKKMINHQIEALDRKAKARFIEMFHGLPYAK